MAFAANGHFTEGYFELFVLGVTEECTNLA